MTRSPLSPMTLMALSLLGTTLLATSARQATAQNPVIDMRLSTGVRYDPFDDHVTVVRNRDIVRASALDPHRDRIDPGSFVRVDRYYRDSRGRLVHEFGTQWTSYGVPHGNLTRQVVTQTPASLSTPSVEWQDRGTVVYSQRPAYEVNRVTYLRPGTTTVSDTNVAYSVNPQGTGHNHNHSDSHGHFGGNHSGHSHSGSSIIINSTTTYRSALSRR
jgi:hypothetical protein